MSSGTGRVFGAPVTLDVRRAAGENGQAQAQLSLQLDDAARAKAGFAVTGVAGVVAAQVATKLPFEDADAQVELDFTKATLENPLPGVAKPAGKPGKASFNSGQAAGRLGAGAIIGGGRRRAARRRRRSLPRRRLSLGAARRRCGCRPATTCASRRRAPATG